jgi:hypothetical protein
VYPHQQPCAFEQYPGAASAPLPGTYRPRSPQSSVLHQVVRENLLTFLEDGCQRSADGEGYPAYVAKEFAELLGCGDPSRGFARLKCQDCGFERLLPFSCKNRGVCPSCTTRRMSDEAAYLVDIVLPKARYRQWTITFPWPLRFLMARDHKVITEMLRIAMRILFAWQRRQARRAGYRDAKTAAVAFVQRFGGALNLNVHLHVLLPDAVFVVGDGDCLDVVQLCPPRDNDIVCLVQRLAKRVGQWAQRRYGTDDTSDETLLDGAIVDAMRKLPLLHADDDATDAGRADERLELSRRCAAIDGFSIHANTAVVASDRLGLEKLCRYGMRPAFSHERLRLTKDGKVELALRKPWPSPDGISVLQLEPVQFLRRLTPLIPPPFAHLIRYFGLFAPNAKLRDLLPAAPVSPAAIRPEALLQNSGTAAASKPDNASPPSEKTADNSQLGPRPPRTVLPWAELLRRVFAIDVTRCPICLGPMAVIAYLTDPPVLAKIIAHLKLPTSPPLAPARSPTEQLDLDFVDDWPDDDPAPTAWPHPGRSPPSPPDDYVC